MTKAVPLACIGLVLCAQAQAQDTAPDCVALLAGLTSLTGYQADISPAAPVDGACVLDGARLTHDRPGWPDLRAERARLGQADGALWVELAGLRVQPRLGDRTVDDRLRQMVRLQTIDMTASVAAGKDGAPTLAQAEVELSGGTRVTLTASLATGDLSLAALPGARLQDLRIDWLNDGRLLRPVMELAGEDLAGVEGPAAVDAARAALAEVVSAMPGAALADTDRKALAALVADLPQGHGRLVLQLADAEGIGAVDLGLMALADTPASPEALGRFLAGTTILADWQPGIAP